jgi:hypothetical protein
LFVADFRRLDKVRPDRQDLAVFSAGGQRYVALQPAGEEHHSGHDHHDNKQPIGDVRDWTGSGSHAVVTTTALLSGALMRRQINNGRPSGDAKPSGEAASLKH